MSEKKITIHEIAQLAGVSPTAVSFVINGKPGVSSATRQKVRAVIEANHFVPNAASQRLTTKKSFNVALIYPYSASPFVDMYYCEVASALTEALTESRYNVVLVPTPDASFAEVPDIIRRQDADGAVFLQQASPALLDKLDELQFPYLLMDLHEADEKHTHVSLDCSYFMAECVRYLVKKGHRRIAFLGSDRLPSYHIRCFSGYQQGLAEAQLSLQPSWIQISANSAFSDAQCIDRLLALEERPTAVCCISDVNAIHAIRHCRQIGVHVPADLSFISIDDILLSRYITPPLTCISCPKEAMGRRAAELLLQKIAGQEARTCIFRDFTFAERGSVAELTPQA